MKRRTFAVPLVIALSLAFFGLWAQGAVPDVPTGQWLPGPALAQPRAGAVSVALDDGRVLVIGGRTSQGPVNTVEVLNADGSMAVAAPMLARRTGHAAAKLPDGRVLVVGGTTVVTSETENGPVTSEAVTNLAEIFDSFANVWYPAASLAVGRSGHTATAVADGRVLVAGGTGQDGAALDSFEVFDAETGQFAIPGLMSAARAEHAATVAGTTKVLVAGGRNGNGVLGTADVLDLESGTVSSVLLNSPRAGASATTLLDGTILVAGGSNGVENVASAEVIDSVAGLSMPTGSMGHPRRGHEALLLPHNNTVLITGGLQGDAVVPAAEQFIPWTGEFWATGSPAAARSAAMLSVLQKDGAAWLAGGRSGDGSSVAGSELYGFATVKTDAADYPPGTVVTMTGSGWQPGERVTLLLHEVGTGHADRTYFADADAAGRIVNSEFATDFSHIGVRFYLTARGSASQARATFTDALNIIVARSAPQAANLHVTGGQTFSLTFEIGSNNTASDKEATVSGTYALTYSPGLVLQAGGPAVTSVFSGVSKTQSTFLTWTFLAPSGTYDNGTVGLSATITSPSCTGNGCSNTGSYSIDVPAATDSTGPVITPSITGTLGNNGWYTSDVNVSWTMTDPESAITTTTGCDPTTINSDTAGTTLTCSATSAGGTASQSVTIKRDATGPTASASASPAANANGWNNSDVTVTFTGADGLSGFASCSSPVVVSGEGAGQSASGTCTDNAGNSTTATASGINIDKTAPSVSASVSPAANANGWYNANVTVSFSGSDGLSGLDVCSADVVLTGEGAGQSASGTCADEAGNVSASATASGINIDKTAPAITLVSVLPAANSHNWRNTDVTATWSCSDTLSGVVSATAQQTVATEGADQSTTGTCTDLAGNDGTDTEHGINIDKTAPSATASVSPVANANGWHNANVTVSFSGTDTRSGIDDCSPDVVLNAEGADQSASGTCTDNAGNVSASATASGINIDKTAPAITLVSVLPVANAHGWRNADVTATWSCSDTLSGVVNAAAQQTVTTEAANQSASGTCTDKAGNVTSDTRGGINIDKTAPSLNPSVTPNPVVLNGSATAAADASDELAGITTETCGAVNAALVGSKTLTCTATDKAGNSSTADASYSVQYASGGYCLGNAGRQILQPVNADGFSVFKKGSTVPAKFRVCDANGASVGLAGVVTSFRLIQAINGTVADVDEPVISTTPDMAFRWSASDQQWIFNMNTKGLSANTTYVYRIILNDGGAPIDFRFGLK